MRTLVAIPLLLLAACASNIPYEIRRDVTAEADVPVDVVRARFEEYQGWQVRWGGEIVAVENKPSESWIEIIRKPLDSYGRPKTSDQSMGRFLVRIDKFVDPAIYEEGRDLTVYGAVESKVLRKIDEHPYDYPLIGAQTHYLWTDYARRSRYADYRYPYAYPYGFYPYYHPYRFRLHYGHGFGHRRFHRFGFGYSGFY